MHILVFTKMLIILRLSTKHANFWLGVQYPRKLMASVLKYSGKPHYHSSVLKEEIIVLIHLVVVNITSINLFQSICR